MSNIKFTPISKIGEFGLINRLSKNIIPKHTETKMGIGDDAAVLSISKDCDHLISTDMLVGGIHFDINYAPLKHLGYKSIVANISDICAMNGLPTHALVSIAVPNKYSVEMIEELYVGIKLACNNFSIDLIGGDTTASSGPLNISITMFGKSDSKKVTYRSGSKPNDVLVVTGNLGAAYLGLQILERENTIFKENNFSQPNLSAYSYLLERQLKPEPRIDVIKNFKKLNIIPTSMIDISDGLSSELIHLSNSSNLGLKVFADKIPIADETQKTSKELNLDPTVCALHGGEDYELLFTLSLKNYEAIKDNSAFSAIGHTTRESDKVELFTGENISINLKEDGWDHFRKK